MVKYIQSYLRLVELTHTQLSTQWSTLSPEQIYRR